MVYILIFLPTYLVVFLTHGAYASLPIESNCGGGSTCTTPSLCQEGWTFGAKRCYRTVSTSASYKEAQSMCNLERGYLPVVTISRENTFLGSAEGSNKKWIGFNDLVSEGTFVWDDEYKESASFTAWNTGEPNGVTEDCTLMRSTNTWNDIRCTHSKYAICEMDLTPRQWYPKGRSMYLFNTITQDWFYARDSCEDVGAHLVSIGDSDENSFINSMTPTIMSGLWYIGYNDYDSEGSFVWPDSGEFNTFSAWYGSEPDGGSAEDAAVTGYNSNYWMDISTSSNYPSICEKGIEWHYFNGKRYFATDYRLSATDAITRCTDIGGYLAVITSNEENIFLVNMITKSHYSKLEFYIGYVSDSDTVWSWPDSAESLFSNWGESEGQMASACATLSLADGQWKDVDCISIHGFICEAEIPWIPWHNEKYYINTTPLSYDKARVVCQKLGGDVVSYDTIEEQTLVEKLMQRTQILTSKYTNVYIGNHKEEGVFKWARTDTASSLSNWCSGEPSGGSEYCTEYKTTSSCYNDIGCSAFRASICETDLYSTDNALWERRRYYVNIEGDQPYSGAESRCNEMGMKLASVTSQYEMNVVMEVINQLPYTGNSYYIGYNDITTEGTYVWGSTYSRAQTTGFELWSSSATFGDSNDCTVIRQSYRDWSPVPCSDYYNHVCETGWTEDYVFKADGISLSDVAPDAQNTCVQGHTLQEVKARSLIECMHSCITESRCLSVNYYSSPYMDDVSNCQLNEILRSDYPDDVFKLSTCNYYEFKSSSVNTN